MKDPTRTYFAQPIVYVWGILEKDGAILCIRRVNSRNRPIWSLPGGAVRDTETLTLALANRVYEQTRLTIAPKAEIMVQEERSGARHIVYLMALVDGTVKPQKSILDVSWVSSLPLPTAMKLSDVQKRALEAYRDQL